MKVAILVNHKTAALSFADIFKKMNHDVYIPVHCGIEFGAFAGIDVINTRTISNVIIDQYDLYDINIHQSTIEKLTNELLNNFDIIITYHPINTELNRKLSNQTKVKLYVVIWGELFGDVIHPNIELFLCEFKQSNHKFIVCHAHLFKLLPSYVNVKYLPLGMPSYVERMYSSYTGHLDFIIIVQSRLNNPVWVEFKKMIDTISILNQNYTFIVCGKDNLDVQFKSQNVMNLYMKKYEDVLKFMSISKLMICNDTKCVTLQYSPIEAACIGLPFIYSSEHTSLTSEIGKVPEFTYTTIETCSNRIRNLMSTPFDLLKQKAAYQRKLADKRLLTCILPYWEKEFYD
jgi:hypothetical protein